MTLKGEDDTKEVNEPVLVVEVVDRKRRKNNSTNKICTKEYEVDGEEGGRAT